MALGQRCVGVEQDALGVTARFADGSTARGDLLIGCDGIRSVVRAQLIGDGAPVYAGYTAYRQSRASILRAYRPANTGAAARVSASPR